MDEPQQDSLSGLDWLLIVVLLGSLAGFGWYWYQSRPDSQGIRQQVTAQWTNVLTIDMQLGTQLSESSILRGEDAVILVPPDMASEINPNQLLAYTGIQNLQNMGLISPITANIFTPQNPEFSQLRLLIYSEKGTKMTLVPLYQAGIRAIEFDRGRLLVRASMGNIETEQQVGYTVMSDGTQRHIHLVPMYNQSLQGQAVLATH